MPRMNPTCPKCGTRSMKRGPKTHSGKLRWVCYTGYGKDREMCYSTTNPDRAVHYPGEPESKKQFSQKLKSQTIVVTWAQNATPVHKGFLRALQSYCRSRKADLVVVPGRYKNPTSFFSESQVNAQWWEPSVVPYLLNQRTHLHRGLLLLGDIVVQPTANMPLMGFEGISHSESAIIGHPKLQMNVIPAPHQRLPKILTTTGAVTVSNYSDSKAGKKGDFHHIFGAVVVELDGAHFHIRHLNARADGAFCDLDRIYYPDGSIAKAGPYKALVFGDTHVRFTDKDVTQATFGAEGLVECLNPKSLVFHDLLDAYAVNPYHRDRYHVLTP